ncbi:hypothetical protein ACP8HI_14040 [Paenibacillus sp. FA6]|uniref:hypothetical protein n=1 Tax=Paenibacillus sp. FA6 TaxID=3413029 RepID=UPI003F6604A1
MEDDKYGSETHDDPIQKDEGVRKKSTLHANLYKRADYPRMTHNHKEEYAAEMTSTPARIHDDKIQNKDSDVEEMDDRTGKVAGYVGLALGVVSLFMWSIVLGPISVLIGYYAYSQGRKGTGAWSMGLGILATLSYFFLIPFGR